MRNNPFPLDKFTDKAVNEAYEAARTTLAAATTEKQRVEIKEAADHQRNQALSRGPLLDAACTYLRLAQTGVTIKADDPEEAEGPEKFYHFAAHALRDLGLLQHAAESYFSAALVGYQQYVKDGIGNADLARRSAGRAKVMFSELGDDENSGDSHALQQRIRFTEFKRRKQYSLSVLYWLWDQVSRFGTSPSRWLSSTLLTILVFAILYPILICCGHFSPAPDVQRSGLALLTSSLTFSVGNLFQFGTLGTLTPMSMLGQLIAVTHGVIAFVLVGTGATFLTRS